MFFDFLNYTHTHTHRGVQSVCNEESTNILIFDYSTFLVPRMRTKLNQACRMLPWENVFYKPHRINIPIFTRQGKMENQNVTILEKNTFLKKINDQFSKTIISVFGMTYI